MGRIFLQGLLLLLPLHDHYCYYYLMEEKKLKKDYEDFKNKTPISLASTLTLYNYGLRKNEGVLGQEKKHL